MPPSSDLQLVEAFCSYCGGRPGSAWLQQPRRVCDVCELGIMLKAPLDGAPHADDPFLIVDDRLTVQAISRRAERELQVREPDCVYAPLEEFLRPPVETGEGSRFALLVTLAAAGSPRGATLDLRRVGSPGVGFTVRIGNCGPPSSALLILIPARERPGRLVDDIANPTISRTQRSLVQRPSAA